jgi:hypothetical protein
MEIFIIYVLFSVVAGFIASKKGRSGFGFFLLAFLLSPLVGVIAALIVSENTRSVEDQAVASGSSRKCPSCAELIKFEAIVCRFCGRDAPPVNPEGVVQKNSSSQSAFDKWNSN